MSFRASLTARRIVPAITLTAFLIASAPSALALDQEHREKAEQALDRAFEYLQSQQNADGSWSPEPGPAVTGLVVAGMLASPDVDREHPAVSAGISYILSHQKDDGGFYDQILPNYNTSISLMALGRIRNADPEVNQAVRDAQDFLRDLQWNSDEQDPNSQTITEDHPWYGGAGYGGSGRPDLSNTSTLIAGLNDSGLICTDPAYQRALTFITRLQGTEANEKHGDQIQPDGGFIYAPSTDKDHVGTLESKAGEFDPDGDGPAKSRLRTYGSMTYAGFMSYLYAQLDRDDPRVQDAFHWIRQNYTLRENPRMGMQGYYYYLHTFSRALHAWGDPVIETTDGQKHDWANELIDRLVDLQRDNGSWVNPEDRWREGDPNLVTAYAVLALQHALQ